MSCSVIIVAYNSKDFISSCLFSVENALQDLDSEIIVLDNGSPSPITRDIKESFPRVHWVESKENLGFGKACNLLASKATKPYLFFLNPDTIVSKNVFINTLRFIKNTENSGLVGCRILNEDGSLQWSCRRSFPSPLSAVFKTIGLSALFPKNKFFASYNMTYLDPNIVTEVDAISGSFFGVEASFYKELGGFDEDFFMYGEDLDLCFRAKKKGRKNYYYPDSSIIHFRGRSSKTRRFKSYIDFYSAMRIFNRKHKQFNIPHFLVSLGIFFASLVGVFSRLIPQFWKMFIDVLIVLSCSYFISPWFSVLLGLGVGLPLLFVGEYSTPNLNLKYHLKTLFPFSVLASFFFSFYFDKPLLLTLSTSFIALLGVFFWRRFLFWFIYFYQVFSKKRKRSIILGGTQDSLADWFDLYDMLPKQEVLGCVSHYVDQISESNRKHLLGSVKNIESIVQRTGAKELLVYSNYLGFREQIRESLVQKLSLNAFLLINCRENDDIALVKLSFLD
ncbi:MAG: glycosyltransferase family 2 protein [Fibrobacter sp.]|jgi:GT2 family glycosyltransferase|nr:glycosyltransferase family 2 protein [Fibrobacter sp.]